MNMMRMGLLIGMAGLISLQQGSLGKDKDQIVSAVEISKVYAEGQEVFDKAYKGKTVVVEGVVSASSVLSGRQTFLLVSGHTKPGDKSAQIVRFEESGDEFEGIRIGHKVHIRGTVQGQVENQGAVELRDCKVVKVFAKEYPPSKEVRAEVKKLQGDWKVIGMEANGKKLAGAEAPFTVVSFKGYNVYLYQGNQGLHFGLSLDLAKDPKQMDLLGANATLPSIYMLNGEKVQLFLPARLKSGGFLRAGGFDTVKNAGILLKIERQK